MPPAKSLDATAHAQNTVIHKNAGDEWFRVFELTGSVKKANEAAAYHDPDFVPRDVDEDDLYQGGGGRSRSRSSGGGGGSDNVKDYTSQIFDIMKQKHEVNDEEVNFTYDEAKKIVDDSRNSFRAMEESEQTRRRSKKQMGELLDQAEVQESFAPSFVQEAQQLPPIGGAVPSTIEAEREAQRVLRVQRQLAKGPDKYLMDTQLINPDAVTEPPLEFWRFHASQHDYLQLPFGKPSGLMPDKTATKESREEYENYLGAHAIARLGGGVGKPPTAATEDDYRSLPPGVEFISRDGRLHRKPNNAKMVTPPPPESPMLPNPNAKRYQRNKQ
jgi:hypothetical protein